MLEAENTGATEESTGSESIAPESGGVETGNGKDTAPSLPEIDKYEKFKWEGKEWTAKDLKNSVLMQQDYSRKTQELAQERKFYDNLRFDLENVRKNPALEAKFREIYPEKFHNYLEWIRQTAQTPGNPQQAETKQPQLDPQLISRIDQIEKMVTEDKVVALEAKLEAQDKAMSSKYPMADIEAVYARAQAELNKGNKLTEETWDQIWKGDHDKHQKRYESHYKKQVETQKAAIKQGKDIASGGGIPGQAPKKTRLKDVADEYLKGLTG